MFFGVTGRSRFYFNTLGVFYLFHRLSSFEPRDYRVVFFTQTEKPRSMRGFFFCAGALLYIVLLQFACQGIGYHLAIDDPDGPGGLTGNVIVMGDEDDGASLLI